MPFRPRSASHCKSARDTAVRDIERLASERQRHGDDATFGGRVGGLSDLAVKCSNRGGAHDDAAFATGRRFIYRHRRRGEPDHVERADQIDLDDAREMREWLHALLAEYAFRGRNSGGADGAVDRPELLERAL